MKKTSKRISLLLRKKGFFMCTTSMLLANVSVFASPDAAKTSLLPAKSDVASVAIVAQQGKTITGVVMDFYYRCKCDGKRYDKRYDNRF